MRAILSPLAVVLLIACVVGACSAEESFLDQAQPPCGKCDGWGGDDRYEIYEQPPEFVARVASSVGVMVDSAALELGGDGSASMRPSVRSLGALLGLCESERFFGQPVLGYCSGFFAGKDIFVTAAHCLANTSVDPQERCARTHVLFDFAYRREPTDPMAAIGRFSPDSVYRCQEVLFLEEKAAPDRYDADFAVLRLDRAVRGREGLPFRREGRIEVGDRVFMLGHPQGLPMKMSTNGVVQADIKTGDDPLYAAMDGGDGLYFDLEMFGGNSGGPVFNSMTGLVEGVAHAYSGQDWIDDAEQGCKVMGRCGVNAVCPYYPGAYPTTEYASRLDAWITDEPTTP